MKTDTHYTTQELYQALMLPEGEGDSAKQYRHWFGAVLSNTAQMRTLIQLVNALDQTISARRIYDALPHISDRSMDILDISHTLSNLGYSCHRMEMMASHIDVRLLPCVYVSAASASPLVLFDRTEDQLRVYNSDTDSEEAVAIESLAKGYALFFVTEKHEGVFDQVQEKGSETPSFGKVIKRFTVAFSAVILMSLALNIFALAMPVFVMLTYEQVIQSGHSDTLYYLAVGALIAFVSEIVLRGFRAFSVSWMSARIDTIISQSVYQKLIEMQSSLSENTSIAAQVAKVKSLESFSHFFTGSLFASVLEIPFVLVMLATIGWLGGQLVLVPIGAIMCLVVFLRLCKGRIESLIKKQSQAETLKQEILLGTCAKHDVFRVNGMSSAWLQRIQDSSAASSLASFRVGISMKVIETVCSVTTSVTVMLSLVIGIQMVWNGQLGVGALVACMIIIWRVISSLQSASNILPKLHQLKQNIKQFDQLMQAGSGNAQKRSALRVSSIEGYVELMNVGIRYENSALPVIIGLSLEVKPGELVAITGENGSGKTTVLKLINRLYTPQIGCIRIDGVDIRQIDKSQLRQAVDYIPQTPEFFEGSIADNLRMANPLAADKDLEKALLEVGALDDVKQLPNGIHSVIRPDDELIGSSLSYQLNLSRALLKESNILLLDELPFAVLNSKSGSAYRHLLESMKGKKTVFFVTHREDHSQLADKVIYLRRERPPRVMDPRDMAQAKG